MANVTQINLTVYNNCDDVQLFWCTKITDNKINGIPNCIGFSIERQRKDSAGNFGSTEILRNRVGFSIENISTDSDSISKPSNIWPFQSYKWTDYGANNNEILRYRIVALRLPSNGIPGTSILEEITASDWTEPIEVNANCNNNTYAFFNRGFVMSQFVARIARQNNWGPRDIKNHIKDMEEPLRRFLSGELRLALLGLLDEVIRNPDLELYAALYELSDEELISQLILLHQRAHIVLSNGSDKKGDGNADARKTLNNANVDVHDRILRTKGLGHNKFAVVFNKRTKKPIKIWTGSTNWASTGLCTQANNAILLEDEHIAKFYYDQWNNLAEAGDNFPPELVEENATSPKISGNTRVWFTRIRNKSKKNVGLGADLQELIDQVKTAKKCVLYVMFQPGAEPLKTILNLPTNIIVKGTVSTLTSDNEEKFSLDGNETTHRSELVVPEGITVNFSYWLKEVTRSEFLYPFQNPGIGHAITHSKMIVIDPLDKINCKVITGSHNFSGSASEMNDENFVVISGNQKLAQAYAVACLSTYNHYRWRVHVKEKMGKGEKPWSHLSDKPTWQDTYNRDKELISMLKYWCGW